MAQEVDVAMPEMEPTHLLLNYYVTALGMNWHSDDDPNDGDGDIPIVSISLGNSCRFG
jgi:alkylated DNA repair dioxygenase AlkB